MKSIVIATDGSDRAREAVEVGVELAREQDAEVTFVLVSPADDFIATRAGPPVPLPHRLETDEPALIEAAAAADEAGVDYALEHFAGYPADVILEVADEKDADLIVIGSRGRGAVASALLGSVSRTVMAQAKRSVLVVRGSKVAAPAG